MKKEKEKRVVMEEEEGDKAGEMCENQRRWLQKETKENCNVYLKMLIQVGEKESID